MGSRDQHSQQKNMKLAGRKLFSISWLKYFDISWWKYFDISCSISLWLLLLNHIWWKPLEFDTCSQYTFCRYSFPIANGNILSFGGNALSLLMFVIKKHQEFDHRPSQSAADSELMLILHSYAAILRNEAIWFR